MTADMSGARLMAEFSIIKPRQIWHGAARTPAAATKATTAYATSRAETHVRIARAAARAAAHPCAQSGARFGRPCASAPAGRRALREPREHTHAAEGARTHTCGTRARARTSCRITRAAEPRARSRCRSRARAHSQASSTLGAARQRHGLRLWRRDGGVVCAPGLSSHPTLDAWRSSRSADNPPM